MRGMVRALLGVLLGAVLASGAFGEEPVVLRMGAFDGNLIEVGQGLAQGEDLWVPVGVLRRLGANVAADGPARRVWVEPGTNLSLPEGVVLPPGEGLRLNARAKSVSGDLYLRVRGWERALGVRGDRGDDGSWTLRRLEGPGDLPEASLPLSFDRTALPERFTLAWDPVFRTNPDQDPDFPQGLDVISPSWFVVQPDGEVENNGSVAYVRGAHLRGAQVWALVHNGFKADRTSVFLNDPRAVARTVARLAAYVELLDLDGINLDFENIADRDRDAYTAFVGRVAEALHRQGRKVSVDVTVLSNKPYWSTCYDRKALGELVDYVMVMTYDEHWRTSPRAGSVASLPWVERGVQSLLQLVPANKVLLGVPFYTREWEETPRGGRVSVRSKALSMASADQRIAENGAPVVWLPSAGQHYAEYRKGGRRYRIWLENEQSLELKTSLVRRYGLAGVAAWRKGFEKPSVWPVLHRNVKGL